MRTKHALKILVIGALVWTVAIIAYALVEPRNVNRDTDWKFKGVLESSGGFKISDGDYVLTAQEVEITSPSTTFSAANAYLIELTSDQNVTGVYPIGGILNQVIKIVPGAGSNTIQFDHGTTCVLHGENIILTEGTTNTLTLICFDATTPRWKILDPIASTVNAVANNSTAETVYPLFADGATGAQQVETDTGFTYNPNTGVVTAASFAGVFAGNITSTVATITTAVIGGTTVTASAAEINLVDGLTLIEAGELVIANGATSNTATISGLLPSAYVVATFGEAPTSATKIWAVPSTDSLKIDIDQDNTSDLDVYYIVIQK